MRYVAVAAPRTTRVLKGRPGRRSVSNMPATTVVPRSPATRATSVANGAVERLGVRADVGAGLAEVAGERLREDHQVGVVGRQLGRAGRGWRRVEPGGLLDQRDAEGVSVTHQCHPVPSAGPPVRDSRHAIEPG